MAREVTDFRGIIIYRQNYRERDLLVKMLTDKVGPAMFFVRGAKKRGFRLAADILPFTHGTYIGSLADDGLSFINVASETHQYHHIATNLTRNAYATYILSLADHAFPDHHGIGGWFNQIAAALERIDQGVAPQAVANVIAIQLLTMFGVAPNWDQCVICGQDRWPLDFSEQYGGMLCNRHWHLDSRRLHLDRRTIYFLQRLAHANLQKIKTIKINPVTMRYIQAVVDTIYDDQVGLRLKSKHFINQLQRMEQKMGKLPADD